jgi:2-polyprenyl-3-methyl-5-hydroxy-6-metoxy-1,4-benzoquinol methylase
MDAYLEENKKRWDELVPVHAGSRFYDVDGFLAGRCALLPIEVRELGELVNGRSLVHLQCHFGLDTLSWARRGARVTGVDFSPRALEEARSLAARAKLDARFVESEVTRAPETLNGETFDIVFTSWGVLGWLPDLSAWARAVSALLHPGGTFYIVETHPVAYLFDQSPGRALERTFPYFRTTEPIVEEGEGTYADSSATITQKRRYSWIYELGNVVSLLIEHGLRIDFVHEHPATCSTVFPSMIPAGDGTYVLPPGELSLPLSFSIRATKVG